MKLVLVKTRDKMKFNFNPVSNRGVGREGKFPVPITGCILFLRHCDEVLEVFFLAAVKPSATGK
jgi:hypothetical protein